MPSTPAIGTAPRGISVWYGQTSGTSPYLPMLIASSVRPCFVGLRARVPFRRHVHPAEVDFLAPTAAAHELLRLLGGDAHVHVADEVGFGRAGGECAADEVQPASRRASAFAVSSADGSAAAAAGLRGEEAARLLGA